MWSNTWALRPGRVLLDAETREVTLALRVGLLERLEVGVHVPYLWRGGGTLDGFVEGFHEVFGIKQRHRDLAKRDRYRVEGVEEDGSAYRLDGKGTGLGDVTLAGRVLISRGDAHLPAASLTLRLRLPTAASRLGHASGVDPSLALDLSKRVASLPLVAYLGLAYTYYADARNDGLTLLRHRAFGYLGLEWEITDHVSVVTHLWMESRRELRLFDDAPGVPDVGLAYGNFVSYWAAGVKVSPLTGLTLELGILENVVDPETTADLTWLLNASWRF